MKTINRECEYSELNQKRKDQSRNDVRCKRNDLKREKKKLK